MVGALQAGRVQSGANHTRLTPSHLSRLSRLVLIAQEAAEDGRLGGPALDELQAELEYSTRAAKFRDDAVAS